MYFLFDENVPHRFVEGLACIEYSNRKSPCQATVSHPKLIGKEGSTDEEIISLAGERQAIIISFDKDFKHIRSYYPLYKQHKVGVVFFRLSKKESNYWGIVTLIINQWEELKMKLKDESPPFAYEISKQGIKRYEF